MNKSCGFNAVAVFSLSLNNTVFKDLQKQKENMWMHKRLVFFYVYRRWL